MVHPVAVSLDAPPKSEASGDTSMPWWAISLRGVAMGAADVVPGVSGGTIALVVGIYPRFIQALTNLDVGLLRRMLAGLADGVPGLWRAAKEADVPFLVALGAGILVALLSLAKLIPDLIETYPATMNGLFFGMIAASIAVPYRMLSRRGLPEGISFVAATAFAFWIAGLGLFEVQSGLPFLFVCGAIAISAMLLPGVSGSFLLLILGQYTRVLDAIHERDIVVIIVFGAGCAVGLLGFSRLLRYLLTRFRNITLAALCGLMVGSLRKIWPFKVALDEPLVVAGKTVSTGTNAWPFDPAYAGPIVGPVLAMLVGFAVVALLERLSERPS